MVQKGIRELFGDVIIDTEFRSLLLTNSEEAIHLGGYKIDSNQMEMINEILAVENLSNLSIEALEERRALCSASLHIDIDVQIGKKAERD
jgi:hypothetical protein